MYSSTDDAVSKYLMRHPNAVSTNCADGFCKKDRFVSQEEKIYWQAYNQTIDNNRQKAEAAPANEAIYFLGGPAGAAIRSALAVKGTEELINAVDDASKGEYKEALKGAGLGGLDLLGARAPAIGAAGVGKAAATDKVGLESVETAINMAKADRMAAEASIATDSSPRITITGTEPVKPLANGDTSLNAEQTKFSEIFNVSQLGIDTDIYAKHVAGDVRVKKELGNVASESTAVSSMPIKSPIEFDPNKFNYLFGHVVSGSEHNIKRSRQLSLTMKRLGITDDVKGYNVLISHFEDVVADKSNVVEKFVKNGELFENRESLIFGPSGRSAKFSTTFEVMPDGIRRFITVIPREGEK